MALVPFQKIKLSTTSQSALLLFSQTVTTVTTENIVLRHDFSCSRPSTSEGSLGADQCWRITEQDCTITWSAQINRFITETTSDVSFVHWLAEHVEGVGANITVFGGIIFLAGVAADAGIITLPAGLVANTVGGVLLALGGICWAAGGLISKASKGDTTTRTETDTDSGAKSCHTKAYERIECEGTYPHITLEPCSIDDCVLEIMANI